MTKRYNYSSGAKWEEIVGYSRAVKIGNVVEVSGTTAINNGEVVGKGDAYEQTLFILKKIEAVLETAGSSLQDVVRTRIYVTNIEDWEAVGKAHNHYFNTIKPATTLVEVSNLVSKDFLVEIEVSAVITEMSSLN